MKFDVAIIGGGPGGSTTGSLIKKYAPEMSVGIFEREKFPREHVGESQLPPIGAVLNEMGCYDKVEAANFPVKIGASYRWGQSEKLWDFEFVPLKQYTPVERPRKFDGQVRQLAFQVERAIYDEILLDHAQELGCEVFEETKVEKIHREGDRITHLELEDGTRVEADYYIDASGNSGMLRRAMDVNIQSPSKLQNVAFWDYWENAEWATKFDGGATRVLVLSIGSGWIWYIPLGPTRTSIGFICPAAYYKEQTKTPKELYDWALSQEPLIADLTKNASRHNEVRSTRDWSYVADRLYGENWFLVGETAGFADPILAAGLTLTHTGARELAYTLIALKQGTHEAKWLCDHYEQNQIQRVRQHIRFADFWYVGNGIFTDLQEFTREIASDAGLQLNATEAFRWLGTGGFTHDNLGQVGIGGLDLAGARQVAQILYDADHPWTIDRLNYYKLNLDGSEKSTMPTYQNGKIEAVPCFIREGKVLPNAGVFATLIDSLKTPCDAPQLHDRLQFALSRESSSVAKGLVYDALLQGLEIMVNEKWVKGKYEPLRGKFNVRSPREGNLIHTNVETNERIGDLKKS